MTRWRKAPRGALQGVLMGLALVALLAFGSNARASSIITFDFPGSGIATLPSAISNNGNIVGTISDMSGTRLRGFERFANGTFSLPIVHPSDTGNFTRANGLNSPGTIDGDFFGTSAFHAFTLNGSTFTTFDIGGPVSTSYFGINDLGHVIGVFGSFVSPNQAFLSVGGIDTVFAFPGAGTGGTFAYGINNADAIVGQYFDVTGNSHGFMRDPSGALTGIDVPGALYTTAGGINDAGKIVGTFQDSGGTFHGFLLDAGVFTTFDVPGSFSTGISGINNAGDFVGSYSNATGTHGFVVMNAAVPEPASMTMLGLGIAGLFGYRARRRMAAAV